MVSVRLQRQIDRLLDEAEAAITELDWAVVRDRAQAVLAIDAENEEGRAFLATAERALNGSTEPPAEQPLSASASPADQPTSFADGRYLVKRFLGEGGKKKVYMAHDELLDRDIAFALIKSEGLDDISRERITREAQSMGRLGSHPNIVTVLDLGDQDGQPYMVIELLAGGDVEGVVEDAPDHKLPLDQAVRIAVETCRGLEFAHERGIIHRDLKPGNVWLTGDGTAKIGDFGLAVAVDRSRLTQQGMMVGTVSYMPPEQAMGGEVTAKADLYSLGAMLYEMVTGRPPFLGDDQVAIIGQHINTQAVGPTWHRSDCPRPLEAIIMRLLSKNPDERPNNAEDVRVALEAIDLVPSTGSPTPAEGDANVLDSLAGGVFVGRQREMGELKAALEDVLSGRGRMVMLVGEPGIGKTRTAQELATFAGLRGCQVVWGRCHESRGAPPYWPWIHVIRSYVKEREPEKLSSEMGSGAADIAEIVSDVKERLPGLEPATQINDPEQARFRLFDSIASFLKSASISKPLVIILDNLHWGDKPSLLLLEFLAPELANSRLMIIGTYRDVDLSRQHPLSETLGELTRERLFERVLLRGLSRDDVERFIELVSGIIPPKSLVQSVYTQTEGNPLFVTEVVRLLVQEGQLSQKPEADRDSWEVRIPEGVREVIGRRLNKLSERCNQTLTIAAVIGREFEMRQLARLFDDTSEASGQRMSEDRLLEVIEEGLAARVIEELPDSVGVYQFTHALIQQTFFNELTTTRRVRLHARIFEVLEELYGDSVEAHTVELAYHAAEAESLIGPEKLVRYSQMAGDRAFSAYAYEEALANYERGLTAKGVSLTGTEQAQDAETAALLFGAGRARTGTLEFYQLSETVESLTRAFDYYAEVGDIDRTVSVATHLPPGGIIGLPGMFQLVTRALELVPSDSHNAGRLLSLHGRNLAMAESDYAGANAAFNRALAIARREKNNTLEMGVLGNISQVEFHYFNGQASVDNGLRAIDLAQKANRPDAEMLARTFTSLGFALIGDVKAMRLQAEALLAHSEKVRSRVLASTAFWTNQLVASYCGEWQAAREFSDRGLTAAPHDARLLGTRPILECQVGNFDQAQTYSVRLVEVMRLVPPGPTFEYTYCALTIPVVASFTGELGQLDAAKEAAEIVISSSATPSLVAGARSGLAVMAVLQNDTEEAERQYSALQPTRGTVMRNGGVTDRLLGQLAHTMGNVDDAQTHFEDALTFCRKSGSRPDLAWSLSDYADMLLERNGEGDDDRATTMLDEALAISSELGMRPLMERVLSRRDILKA
jgi:eukaryotic-like serine/threonine-protein kinase